MSFLRVRPLQFARIDAEKNVWPGPVEDIETSPAYGDHAYVTPGGFFAVHRQRNGEWCIFATGLLQESHSHTNRAFLDGELHKLRFVRRRDALEHFLHATENE